MDKVEISSDRRLFARGWAYFQQHRDKSYSLTISFIIMEKCAIAAALTLKNGDFLWGLGDRLNLVKNR